MKRIITLILFVGMSVGMNVAQDFNIRQLAQDVDITDTVKKRPKTRAVIAVFTSALPQKRAKVKKSVF